MDDTLKREVERCGRLFIPDERDQDYPLPMMAVAASQRRKRFWNDTHWMGDQGWLPHCVGYAWVGWLEADPIRHPGPTPPYDPSQLYRKAQKVDAWPGENYAGTSVRAGAKILKQAGFIKSYHWARTTHDIVQTLLNVGPVVVGTKWFSNMARPSQGGVGRPTGRLLGGHAYLLTGVNRDTGYFRARNSYGLAWGKEGRLYIKIKDMARLLAQNGEACLAIERRIGE